MFTNILKHTAVICLTFSSMVQMLALPQTTIIAEMKDKLRNCSFPPAEVLEKSSQSSIFSLCDVMKPSMAVSKPIETDLNFFFGKYLCMELFDLSLQLCSINVSKTALPSSEEELSNLALSQNVTNFCERLQFPSSRAKSTGVWADIAIEALNDRKLCETNCIMHNNLNPLCGAIYWASKLLIAGDQKLTIVKADSPVLGSAAEVNPNEEHDSPEKAESPSQSIGKEPVLPKVLSSTLPDIKPLSRKTVEIRKPPVNEETPKTPEMNPVLPVHEKIAPVVNPTQLVVVTTTAAPVTIDPASINIEKVDEHDDEHIHSSKVEMDTPGIEDSRMPPDNFAPNLPPKEMSQDLFGEEGLTDEDTHIGSNSKLISDANESPIETKAFHDTFVDAQDSHFFAYFLTMVVICIIGYLLFHNKQKIIALALEGRRMQGSRRRPNTSSYKKLDSNLEEAVTSTCSSSSVTHVIF